VPLRHEPVVPDEARKDSGHVAEPAAGVKHEIFDGPLHLPRPGW
jgi:hypothetical protein